MNLEYFCAKIMNLNSFGYKFIEVTRLTDTVDELEYLRLEIDEFTKV